jgi:hypothetical protein
MRAMEHVRADRDVAGCPNAVSFQRKLGPISRIDRTMVRRGLGFYIVYLLRSTQHHTAVCPGKGDR